MLPQPDKPTTPVQAAIAGTLVILMGIGAVRSLVISWPTEAERAEQVEQTRQEQIEKNRLCLVAIERAGKRAERILSSA